MERLRSPNPDGSSCRDGIFRRGAGGNPAAASIGVCRRLSGASVLATLFDELDHCVDGFTCWYDDSIGPLCKGNSSLPQGRCGTGKRCGAERQASHIGRPARCVGHGVGADLSAQYLRRQDVEARIADDDRLALDSMVNCLRPGGSLLLDLINPDRLRAELVPESRTGT